MQDEYSENTLFKILKLSFKTVIYFTSVLGIFAIYNFCTGSLYDNPDLLFSVGGAYSFIENSRQGFQETANLEGISNVLVSGCIEEECKARKIYESLSKFEYEPGTEINPEKVWTDKSGDCDEISYLFMSLLKTEGIKSKMQCNHNHCWLIIFLQDKKILVDAVNNIWKEY